MGNLGGSNKVLDIHKAAELLDVPVRRLRDNWRNWGIRAYKVGRELRFKERDLLHWLDGQEAA